MILAIPVASDTTGPQHTGDIPPGFQSMLPAAEHFQSKEILIYLSGIATEIGSHRESALYDPFNSCS